MSKKQITQNSIAVLAAFLAVCGINFLYQIRGTSTMLSNSVTAMLMFGAFTYVGAQFLKKAVNARLLVYGAAGGMRQFRGVCRLGVFAELYGYDLESAGVSGFCSLKSVFYHLCERRAAGIGRRVRKESVC